MKLENKLEEVKKRLNKRYENVERTIKILVKEISIYKKTGMKPEEIKQTIQQDKNKRLQEYIPIAKRVMGIKIQYLAIQYLKQNKEFANKQLEKSKRKENKSQRPPLYDNDVQTAAKVVIREMIRGSRKFSIELTEEQFWNDLNTVEEKIEKALKESYIQLLEKTGEFFACHGFLKEYKETYSRYMKRAGLEEIKYDHINIEDSPCLSIEESFQRSYLQTLSIKELAIVNAFWQNRYGKEERDFNTAMYISDQLNYWEKVPSEEEIEWTDRKGIQENKIRLELLKSEWIKVITKAEEHIALNRRASEENTIKKTIEEVIEESYRMQYAEKYHTSIDSDISEVSNFVQEEEFLYAIKYDDLCFFLVLQSQEKDFVNHGVILEEKTDDFFIIGADVPGRNMPITLHIPCDVACMKLMEMRYTEFSKEKLQTQAENKIMIPVYQGNADRVIDGKFIPTSISMPLSEEQKAYIHTRAKKVSKEETGYYFIQHVDAMTKGQLAAHLKKRDPVTNYLKREELLYDMIEDEVYVKERGKWELEQEEKINEK